jgi:hypothetical protein
LIYGHDRRTANTPRGWVGILRIEFHTEPTGVVHEIAQRIPNVERVEFENAFYADEGNWIESLSISAATPFDPEAVFDELSRAELYHHLQLSTEGADRSTHRVTIIANEPYPFLLGVILREQAIPNRLVLRRDRFEGMVTVQDWPAFRAMADKIQERFGQFELQSVGQVETTGAPLGAGTLVRVLTTELSDEQMLVLEAAYSMGYFDVPRTASASDIADELGIAQSTLSERLRTAEKRLFELVFGSRAEGPPLDGVEK